MASDKVIGGPFDEKVLQQLEVRSHIMSRPTRDDNTLRYLSSRTGWVKMTSSVQVNGTDTLAKKYILIGGTYGRTGADTYSTFANGKGFRPMPGITGVDIKAINRFGLLKEATITYNCWDVSQLQELEMLFMRPGFSVLLEWGHSVYYTTDSNFVTIPQTITSFFTKGTTKEQLYDEIDTLKEKSGHNYDAIYGFIKNFSWSFRADGGYDCITTLTSIGEIIESLQIDVDNPLPQGATAEETNSKSEEFVNAKKLQAKIIEKDPDKLRKDPTTTEYIAIGDSQTVYLDKHSSVFKLVGQEDGFKNLHKTGIGLKTLISYIQVFPVSEAVKGVVVSIGTNDGFRVVDAMTLKSALTRVFPNASKLIMVKGSWNWGYNNADNGVTEKEVKAYYDAFAKVGFTIAHTAIGDMSKYLKKYPAAPHDNRISTYAQIGRELDELAKK